MNKALFYFSMSMAVVYTAIGIYVIVYPDSLAILMSSTYARVVGGLVLAYGLFRGYNALKVENNKSEDEE